MEGLELRLVLSKAHETIEQEHQRKEAKDSIDYDWHSILITKGQLMLIKAALWQLANHSQGQYRDNALGLIDQLNDDLDEITTIENNRTTEP